MGGKTLTQRGPTNRGQGTACLPALLSGVPQCPGELWLLSENCGDLGCGLSYSSDCQMFTFAAICAGRAE